MGHHRLSAVDHRRDLGHAVQFALSTSVLDWLAPARTPNHVTVGDMYETRTSRYSFTGLPVPGSRPEHRSPVRR